MAIVQATIADRRAYDAKSDHEIAQQLAEQAPKVVDDALRALNQSYRAGAGLNFALDPVNMIPINPVGKLLNESYKAVGGSRSPLTVAEIEPVVAWIRANQSP